MNDAVDLHWMAAGDPNNPALLFLHGFMGSLKDWRPVIDELSASFYCIAVDLPWHGDSPQLPPLDNPFQQTAQALIQLLDALHIARCGVIGYSMGGRIALYSAVKNPGRFSPLIIESASPGIHSAAARADRQHWEREMAARLRKNEMCAFLDFWYSQPLFESLRAHPQFEQLYKSRLRNTPAALADAMLALGVGNQSDLWDEICNYRGPMLFLAGEQDAKYASIAEKIAHRRPATDFAVFPKYGHNIHFENCAIFCKKVVEFLNK